MMLLALVDEASSTMLTQAAFTTSTTTPTPMPIAAQNQLDPTYAQFRDLSRFWIQRVAVPLLTVIGLFGNLITIIIMTRRRMRSTTNMYLAALAFVDMLYLVLTFVLGLSHYPNMAESRYYAYWRMRPFLMMLTDACSNTSVWLTVTFTIERYIAVKYPMKGKVWCTEARAKLLIIGVFVFAILFSAPVPFEWQVVEKRVALPSPPTQHVDLVGASSSSSSQNRPKAATTTASINSTSRVVSKVAGSETTVLALDYSDFGRNETYKTIYYWSTAAIFYFVPLFSLMLFNGFLIESVHRSRRERHRMTRHTHASTSAAVAAHAALLSAHAAGVIDAATAAAATANNGASDQVHESRGALSKFKYFMRNATRLTSTATSNSSVPQTPTALPCRPASPVDANRLLCSTQTAADRVDARQETTDDDDVIIEATAAATARTLTSGSGLDDDCDNDNDAAGSERAATPTTLTSHMGALSEQTTPIARTKWWPQRSTRSALVSSATDARTNRGLAAYSTSSPATAVSGGGGAQLAHAAAAAVGGSSSHERRITIMLIAVVILFLVCQIPTAAMLLYTSVRDITPNTNEHALVLGFGNIFNFLMAVNAAGNFILYSFLSKKYRRTFMILFCACFRRQQQHTLAQLQPQNRITHMNSKHAQQYRCKVSQEHQNHYKASLMSATTTTTTTAAQRKQNAMISSHSFAARPLCADAQSRSKLASPSLPSPTTAGVKGSRALLPLPKHCKQSQHSSQENNPLLTADDCCGDTPLQSSRLLINNISSISSASASTATTTTSAAAVAAAATTTATAAAPTTTATATTTTTTTTMGVRLIGTNDKPCDTFV